MKRSGSIALIFCLLTAYGYAADGSNGVVSGTATASDLNNDNAVVAARTTTQNFLTGGNNKAYGNNMVEVESGVWAIYSGDVDQSGYIDGDDLSFVNLRAYLQDSGYLPEDLDGSGYVDGDDLTRVNFNAYFQLGVLSPLQ